MIWMKNGQEIDPSREPKRFNIHQQDDGTVTLTIEKCTFADDDEYSLLVENVAGVDSCSFELIVECPGMGTSLHYVTL